MGYIFRFNGHHSTIRDVNNYKAAGISLLNHAQDLSFAHSVIISTQLAMSLRTIKNGAPMVMDSFRLSTTSKNQKSLRQQEGWQYVAFSKWLSEAKGHKGGFKGKIIIEININKVTWEHVENCQSGSDMNR